MREIKFRGIYIDTGEWVYGYLVNMGDDSAVIFDPKAGSLGTYYVVKKETVGQYTGLKDNTKWEDLAEKERKLWTRHSKPTEWNGKELFEGDIVQVYDGIGKAGIYEIKYMEKGFCMTQKGDRHSLDCIWYFVFEIIGNIYENPELLKQTKTT